MPVTRSTSRPDSQQPSSRPYSSRRAGPSGIGATKKASKAPSNDIIVLSSDDDEPPYKGTPSSRKTSIRPPKRTVVSAVPQAPTEVLEISSDDEPKKSSTRRRTRPSETTTKDLERTIKTLREDLHRSEKLLASASREIKELKRSLASPLYPLSSFMSSNKYTRQVPPGLEEYTSCEVCTLTMWCPYTLPECGHSFCKGCLVDWFGTIQAQHMTANPQLDDNRTALAGQLHTLVQMVPNLHAYGPHGFNHVRAALAELRRHRPEYTCPSCRKEVLNKPVEDFRLKGLIKEIAGMTGETNAHKDAPPQRGSGPFDHFFAAPILAR